MILQLVLLILLLLIVPFAVGFLFVNREQGAIKNLYLWISGQILLWALFQVICVPSILFEMSFSVVVYVFTAVSVLLAVGGICWFVLKERNHGILKLQSHGRERGMACYGKDDKAAGIMWLLFGVLLLLQLVLAVVLAYEEGDDAYYVAISTITVDSDEMYMKLPYTGETTEVDIRHGLAPFPIWIAYLARVTGIPAVTMAQIILPLVLIMMTYGIYYLIGDALFKNRRIYLPLFLIMIEMIVLFGGYSTYSAENFLLVRTAQGKAVLSNIVIPFMLFLLLHMLEALEKGKGIAKKMWIMAALAMIVGCLCSSLGSLLTCILLGIVGSCAVVCYRKWKLFIPMAGCCVIPAACALLYLILD